MPTCWRSPRKSWKPRATSPTENHDALSDPRTNLIVGDGRSHLLLTRRQYDVIISEPSNPWIAGVAALFTREFFEGARARLAPGGILCQWANAYNISDPDLRSIIATFISVFPHGTVWLVGGDDVLMMASDGPLDERLARMRDNWSRPGVADDLALVSVMEPFSLWSLFAGGPAELQRYAAGAALLTDDTMRLEFSAPRELHNRNAGENGATLLGLLSPDGGPGVIREARSTARATQWRNRGAMMAKSDVHARAYDDYLRAPGAGCHRCGRARRPGADGGADQSRGGGAHLAAHVVARPRPGGTRERGPALLARGSQGANRSGDLEAAGGVGGR